MEIGPIINKPPISQNHLIDKIQGNPSAPALVVFGGVHGNEPSGVEAIRNAFSHLQKENNPLQGSLYGFVANPRALGQNKRFISKDLNRVWTLSNIVKIQEEELDLSIWEYAEMAVLHEKIKEIISYHSGKVVFLDLHTTSSHSIPFLTIGDSLNNRNFALRFPCPIILGFEEYVNGTMFTHVNETGYPAIGFEAGMHTDPLSERRHRAMIWLTMMEMGIIDDSYGLKKESEYQHLTVKAPFAHSVFEVVYRHVLPDDHKFKMEGDWPNFVPVSKNHLLAHDGDNKVLAPKTGNVFMPLYQSAGNDGFFIIRRIKKFWLGVSSILRRTGVYRLLPIMPGINKLDPKGTRITASKTITKWYVKEIFHLLGYRLEKTDKMKFVFAKRKFDVDFPWEESDSS